MHPDYPFQIALLVLYIPALLVRVYYQGYARALSPEEISFTQEGFFRYIRFLLGIPMAIVIIAFLIYPPIVSTLQLPLPNALRWIGVPLGMVCTAGLFWTHVHLAEAFSGTVHVRSGAKLVTTGPYKYVKHPMYICFFLGVVSFFLLSANWFIGVVSLFGMMIIVCSRLKIEEDELQKKYGEEYEKYIQE